MAQVNEEQFKTTLMGGFDKEDVLSQFRRLTDTAEAEKNKLMAQISGLNKTIEAKNEELKAKDAALEKLKKDIEEKYQSYIDNYDTIGKIVYETRIKSEQLLKEAKEEGEKMVSAAEMSAKEKISNAQKEVDRTLSEGKRKYAALQEEITEIVNYANQVQQKFMKSIKAIHEISKNVLADEIYSESSTYGGFDDEEEDEDYYKLGL